jgi:hypothetical protein
MTNTVSEIPSSPPKTSPGKQRVIIIVAALLTAVVLGVLAALFVVPRLTGSEEPAPQAAAGGSPAGVVPAGELTEFVHEPTGIALSYPSSWVQLKTNDPQVLLLASDGLENNFLVRAVELPNAVGEPELGAAKQLTDKIVGANKSAKLLVQPKQLTVGGLPGYWYFYSFQDDATGKLGAHSHFFLFKGKTMISFVYQTIPLEKFQASAPVFDQINGSLHQLDK